MSDYEKQKLLDDENFHQVELPEFEEDPFEYAKGLITAICTVTGKPIPSDEEIKTMIDKAIASNDGKLS